MNQYPFIPKFINIFILIFIELYRYFDTLYQNVELLRRALHHLVRWWLLKVEQQNTSANPPILMATICSFTQLVSIKNLKNFTPPLGIKFSQRQKISKKFLDSGSHFFVTRHLRKTILVASLWIAFRQISLTKKFPKSKIYVSLF